MTQTVTKRVRGEGARKRVYGLASKCQVCGKLILPGQTWKFTPEGGKVHYYCGQMGNPRFGRGRGSTSGAAFYTGHVSAPATRVCARACGRKIDLRKRSSFGIGEGGDLICSKCWQKETQALYERRHRFEHENPAGPTFSQAMTMARQAGARIGDTSGFEPWLKRAGLAGRSPHVVSKLRGEFEQGVEYGSPRTRMATSGPRVWQDSEGWRSAIDPESVFETKEEAERFVEGWHRRRNPSAETPRFVPAEDDWPIGPIRWTVIDTYTGAKVTTDRMWVRKVTRAAAERFADKLNRQEQKKRRAV